LRYATSGVENLAERWLDGLLVDEERLLLLRLGQLDPDLSLPPFEDRLRQ